MVVVMERHDSYSHVYLEPGGMFQNRLGHFHHDDIIGKHVGAKVMSRSAGGRFIRLLLPSPELWTMSIKQRTQIVQDLDQSMVVFKLGLRPGMRVLESGTGSGAMSHAILRSISPHGHLHTFEFNEARAIDAQVDFERNRVSHLVTVMHGDICQDLSVSDEESTIVCTSAHMETESDGKDPVGEHTGLAPNGTAAASQSEAPPPPAHPPAVSVAPVARTLCGGIDAVFLDVPSPWLAIPLAAAVLKANARIATYSPCFEQVFKTCEALREHNFHSIRTMEVRHKQFELRRTCMPPLDFGDGDSVGVGEDLGGAVEKGNGVGGDDQNTAHARETGPKKSESEGMEARRSKRKHREAEGGKDARPFAKARPIMRGHTAFLTFAVAGLHPPNSLGPGAVGPTVPDPWIPTSGPPAPAPDPVDELAAEA